MDMLLRIGLSNAILATLLAVMVAFIAPFCRRPAVMHGLWLLVLLKLVTPPLVPIAVPEVSRWALHGEPASLDEVSAEGDATTVANPQSTATAEDPFEVLAEPVPNGNDCGAEIPILEVPTSNPDPIHWQFVVALLWFGSALSWFFGTILGIVRFRRVLRYAWRAPMKLQHECHALARRLGLERAPTLWLVPGAVSPMVWSLGRTPRLIFPAQLIDRLDCESRAALLVHELAHVRRLDHWVRWLECIVTCLFWWHPVVWWARRELHEAEEQCCDAWVVWALDGAGRCYALALLQTVQLLSNVSVHLPAAASGIGHVQHLRRRLTMIMQGNVSRSVSWTGCCTILGLAAMMLPLLAVRAQDAPRRPPADTPPEAGRRDRDREIEELRRKLIELERGRAEEQRDRAVGEKRRAEAERLDRALDSKGRSDSAAKAMDELKALTRKLEEKRHELEELERACQQAKERVGKIMNDQKVFDHERPGQPNPMAQPRPALKGPFTPPMMNYPARRKDASDLESKLDRLLREVEELKQELKREGQPGREKMGNFKPVPPPPPTPDGRKPRTARDGDAKRPADGETGAPPVPAKVRPPAPPAPPVPPIPSAAPAPIAPAIPAAPRAFSGSLGSSY